MKLKFTLSMLPIFLTFIASAQEQVEMADAMRSNGKIYAVVAIILVIFFGLITYLVMLDKRVSTIEKKLKG